MGGTVVSRLIAQITWAFSGLIGVISRPTKSNKSYTPNNMVVSNFSFPPVLTKSLYSHK